MTRDIIRRCRFQPYRKGYGPTFALTLWDTHRPYREGPQWCVGYRLTMKEPDKRRVTLFEAEDYGCSPMHAIDSDASVEGVMGFLTLRPGDTDADYFEGYTAEQLSYCHAYAETLNCEVQARFCDENGNVKRSG